MSINGVVPTMSETTLSRSGRHIVLAVAFLGWMCAGVHMSITQLTSRAAAIDLLHLTGSLDKARLAELTRQAQSKSTPLSAEDANLLKEWDEEVARWFAWYQCSFLFGAATGGLVFGWLGDRFGRTKGMTASILTYSAMAGACYFAQTPEQLLILWYLACTGVGGMWPNGVALVSEAWSGVSRPFMAGVIGTSANIGIFLFATLAAQIRITPDQWRWVMLVGAAPFALGIVSLPIAPESPRWLAARLEQTTTQSAAPSIGEVFRPPLLWVTLVGIVLATTPIIGGWGTANWMVPWSDKAGQASDNPYLKAHVQQMRALAGIVGSLLGGWIASAVGRRRSYFLVSLFSLLIAQFIFWYRYPTDADFLFWVAALGFFSGIYFGWLPLCLPELFPTRVRSTGAGVSFNFGRIVTAITIFTAGMLIALFEGDYARLGRVTSLIFIIGMIVICFAPDTSKKQMND